CYQQAGGIPQLPGAGLGATGHRDRTPERRAAAAGRRLRSAADSDPDAATVGAGTPGLRTGTGRCQKGTQPDGTEKGASGVPATGYPGLSRQPGAAIRASLL